MNTSYNFMQAMLGEAKPCAEQKPKEYEDNIRRQTLDEFRARINDYLMDRHGYGDFVVTDNAIDCVIEQMKGEVDERS